MVFDMNIYVGNLSLDVTEEEIRRVFTSFGVVLSVIMMNDKYIGSGQSKGYGYVEMASISEGQTAVASLKGTVINNRKINVVEALPLNRIKTEPVKKRANKVRERSY
jgi:RNA recognition motif-containing protein